MKTPTTGAGSSAKLRNQEAQAQARAQRAANKAKKREQLLLEETRALMVERAIVIRYVHSREFTAQMERAIRR